VSAASHISQERSALSPFARWWPARVIAPLVVFSICVNLLMLTGPVFMLQVYDRVLSAQSEQTLAALFALVVVLYGSMGVLDHARGRIIGRTASAMEAQMARSVFDAHFAQAPVHQAAQGRGPPAAGAVRLQDAEQISRTLNSPLVLAVIDLPWTPVFLCVLWLLHPLLGMLAIAGALCLLCLAWWAAQVTEHSGQAARVPERDAQSAVALARAAQTHDRGSAIVRAAQHRWIAHMQQRHGVRGRADDRIGAALSAARATRLLLQSAMLALGAYLVLQGALTAGAMIAASILAGRALAPLDQVMGGWSTLRAARAAYVHAV